MQRKLLLLLLLSRFSRVRLFTTPWTAAYQAPPHMGFSRQEYWSGMPLPSQVSVSRDMEFSSIHLPGLGPTWLILPQKGYLQTWWLPARSLSVQFSSVAESCLTPWDPMQAACPSPTPGAYSNSCPLIQDQESVNHASNHAVPPSLSDSATSP